MMYWPPVLWLSASRAPPSWPAAICCMVERAVVPVPVRALTRLLQVVEPIVAICCTLAEARETRVEPVPAAAM